jgi:hypothetical protein
MAAIINNSNPAQGIYSNDQVLNPYLQYDVTISYVMDGGRRQLAVGGLPDPNTRSTPCEIVGVSAAFGKKVVAFTCVRQGDLPSVPAIDPDSPAQVLENSTVTVHPPKPTVDGTNLLFQVTGAYTYILLTPLASGDTLPLGRVPALAGNFNDFSLTVRNTDPNIAP